MAMLQSIAPVAVVLFAIGPSVSTPAIFLIILELTDVPLPIRVDVLTLTMKQIVLPLTFVNIAVRPFDFSESIYGPIAPLAFIDSSIKEAVAVQAIIEILPVHHGVREGLDGGVRVDDHLAKEVICTGTSGVDGDLLICRSSC